MKPLKQLVDRRAILGLVLAHLVPNLSSEHFKLPVPSIQHWYTTMDESFMSTCSFDEDTFLEALNDDVSPIGSNNKTTNALYETSTNSIDISGLLNQPMEELPKAKLEFNEIETPRLEKRHRKRKNNARRCLSTDLNNDFSLNSEVCLFSLLFFL